jgi:hypothetical protein
MGILELLSKVGEDKLRLQFINNSLIDAKDKKVTQDTEITFATAEVTTTQLVNDTGKVGIVVWMNREDYNKSI